jgi:Flp pilus assembly pilin Flp
MTTMRSQITTLRRRAFEDQDGSSMVEFALVAVLLLMIIFGIVEYGLAFRDRLTIGNAGQSAARVGTAVGNGPEADQVMLDALEQTLANLPSGGIGIVKYVDFYKADANGNPVGGCPGGDCVRYYYDYQDGPGPLCDWNPCPGDDGSGGYGGSWTPASRDVQVGSLDVMGVDIVFSHTWITGGLVPLPDVSCTAPPGNCWVDRTTMRMEPQQF